jgi:iron-sulfur cluster repair protein YtfE (RIC family)
MERVDLYSEIHKVQRARLFALVESAGSLASHDDANVADLCATVAVIVGALRVHASAEEEIIRPLLEEAAPGVAKRLHDGHESIAGFLDDVVECSEAFQGSRSPEGLEALYRTLSRFTGGYLFHIAFEEDAGGPALSAKFDEATLLAAKDAFVAAHSPVFSVAAAASIRGS